MQFLTDFADQAVVLPLAACVLLTLAGFGWRRGALAWGVCVAGVLAVMLALKLVMAACGARLGVVSPSGHTATAAVVYGGLLALLMPRSSAWMAALSGGVLAVIFGLTRLGLQVHTLGDVVVGAAVGVTGAVAMRRWAGDRPRSIASPWLLAVAVVVMVMFHGHRLAAEERIRWMALDVWPLSACR